MVVIGPVILLAAIAWAMLRNKTTPAQDDETAAATKRLYKEQSREDAANE